MNTVRAEASSTWDQRFNDYLRTHNRAQDSFRYLVDAGVPESWLLVMLHSYADPGLRQEAQLRYRKIALTSLKELGRTMKAVGKAMDALEQLVTNEELPDWVRDNHFNLRRSLVAQLETYEVAMGDVRRELAKLASEKGEGVSEELLGGLVEAVLDVTGQPQWGHLAYLVEAAYYGHNRRLEADRDLVRKRYDRFVGNFPRVHEEWTGKDWRCFFGLKPHTLSPGNPSNRLEAFLKRFERKSAKNTPIKRLYGKIHSSMKR
jgi:hypothetical protein